MWSRSKALVQSYRDGRQKIRNPGKKTKELSSLAGSFRGLHEDFCERGIRVSIFTALGHPRDTSREVFFKALLRNLSIFRDIVHEEIGGAASDFERILSALDPKPYSGISDNRHDLVYQDYTLDSAECFFSNPEQKQLLKLLLAGQSEEKELRDAARTARNRLLQRYPGLYSLVSPPKSRCLSLAHSQSGVSGVVDA